MRKVNAQKEWERAAGKYSTPHIRKVYIRKPAILKSLGTAQGKKIIDLGCGDGYYSRILAQHGAKVTGVDFSQPAIHLAQKLEQQRPLGIRYFQADISNLRFLKSNTFDAAVADMVFVTIPTQRQYGRCVKEVRRVLKRNGEIIISKGHPGSFFRNRESKYYLLRYNKEPSYFDSLTPQRIAMVIDGKSVRWTNYHRTLEDFLQPWIRNGFVIVNVLEPKPSLSSVQKFPDHLRDTRTVPTFILFKLKKVGL